MNLIYYILACGSVLRYTAAMQKHQIFFIGVLFAAMLHCEAVFALSDKKPEIIIAADSWCPINCSRGDSREGVGIDLARAIYEPLGYRVRYVVMPWADALSKVRFGEVHAVVGAGRVDDPNLVFPATPIMNISDDFYILKGVNWRFQGIESLKRKRLGVIDGYGYGKVVSDYITSNRKTFGAIHEATGNNALRENIEKLQRNQIDVIVETRPVMEYNLSRLHLADKIVWAGSVKQAPVYLAFSPARPQSVGFAKLYDDGMKRLRATGQLSGFYSPYGLRADY